MTGISPGSKEELRGGPRGELQPWQLWSRLRLPKALMLFLYLELVTWERRVGKGKP